MPLGLTFYAFFCSFNERSTLGVGMGEGKSELTEI